MRVDRKYQHPIAVLIASALIAGCQPSPSEPTETQEQTSSSETMDVATALAPNNKTDIDVTDDVDNDQIDGTDSDNHANAMSATDITYDTMPYEYQLPTAVKEVCVEDADIDAIMNSTNEDIACPEFDIEVVKVTPVWIEEAINKQITNQNDPEPTPLTKYLDETATMQIEDGRALSYSVSKHPEELNVHNNVAQFAVHSSQYLGGAHGMQYSDYLLFDMDTSRQLGINDVVQADKQDTFFKLGDKAFHDYLTSIDVTTPEQIADYVSIWEFEPTDNFYFHHTGLIMHYPAYALGSYAQGPIELTIPYDQLQDVLKPQYLPKP